MLSAVTVAVLAASGPEWLDTINTKLADAYNKKDYRTIQSAYDPASLLVANSERIYTGAEVATWASGLRQKGFISSIEFETQFTYQETPTLLHSVVLGNDAPDSQKFYGYTRWVNSTSGWTKAFEAVLRPRTSVSNSRACEGAAPAPQPVSPPQWLSDNLAAFSKGLQTQNVSALVELYHPGALQVPVECDRFVQYADLESYFKGISSGVTGASAEPVHIYAEPSKTVYHEIGTLVTNLGASSYYNRWVLDNGSWTIAVALASVLPGGHC